MLAALTAPPDLDSLVLVLAASSIAALLSRLHRKVILPTVVVEIVLGIAIGPEVLGWAATDAYLLFLQNLGLALLFFFAGLEVVEKKVPRRAVARGSAGWGISLVLGVLAGVVLQLIGVDASWWLLGIALATTSLGTLVPILSDAGLLKTALGTAVLGTGVAGEFWPIVVISVFLTGTYGAGEEIVLLCVFGAIVALGVVVALRSRPTRIVEVLQETLMTTGQAAVRLVLLLLAALVLLAHDVGFDFVLGAFAAGVIAGIALDSRAGETVRLRLEGIAFGFLIPIYFVVTGMNFDLDSLLTARGRRPRGALPRAVARRARSLGGALAARARRPGDARVGALRRHRAATDRGDRRNRCRSRRDQQPGWRLSHRCRDDLGARIPACRHSGGRPPPRCC